MKRSFSGLERNRLFINRSGAQFQDVTGVSGMDSAADARVCVRFDLDRDGFSDVGVINANRPVLELYRNQLADEEVVNGFIALRLVGGANSAKPSEWSTRDAFGTKVYLRAGDLKIVREYRGGEGMAAQNSATMLIGLGTQQQVDELRVVFPSGVELRLNGVASGKLVTVFENLEQSPSGDNFDEQDYRRPVEWSREKPKQLEVDNFDQLTASVADRDEAKYFVFTTMATWCEACHANSPQVKFVRENLAREDVQFIGVPVDAKDTEEKLARYREKFKPPYQVLPPLDEQTLTRFQGLLDSELPVAALPSTIVTDAEGRVLMLDTRAPSLSKLLSVLRDKR